VRRSGRLRVINFRDTLAFSLLELMIVLVVTTVLAIVAIPTAQHLLMDSRQTKQVNQLITAINFARSEAIKKEATVTLCSSADGKRCGGQWRDGQLVKIAGSDTILAVFDALPPGDHLIWRSSFGWNNELKMAATGFADGQNGRFIYCPAKQAEQYGREIIVNHAGRARVSLSGDISDPPCSKDTAE